MFKNVVKRWYCGSKKKDLIFFVFSRCCETQGLRKQGPRLDDITVSTISFALTKSNEV